MRLIDADALRERFIQQYRNDYSHSYQQIMRLMEEEQLIDSAPTIGSAYDEEGKLYIAAPTDLEPVKRGRWEDKWVCSNLCGYDYAMHCSRCKKPTYRFSSEPMPPYCPNCGAKMSGEGEKNAAN